MRASTVSLKFFLIKVTFWGWVDDSVCKKYLLPDPNSGMREPNSYELFPMCALFLMCACKMNTHIHTINKMFFKSCFAYHGNAYL